jgi:chemotaxis protein MotA
VAAIAGPSIGVVFQGFIPQRAAVDLELSAEAEQSRGPHRAPGLGTRRIGMIVLIGSAIVIGAVLAGFTWSGGHVGSLIHPSELVTIGGAAIGAMIVMSPISVLKDLGRGLLSTVKGSSYNKGLYLDLFRLCYELLRIARRDGLLALESHVTQPENSKIIQKYPRIASNHRVVEFLCGGLSPLVEGIAQPEDLPELMETELKIIEAEHHAPLAVLTKTADALPGFGIVAAVLGIVVTMGAIDGPVEEIGHKVGAALVGTFLGILLSYGFVAPLASRMEFLSEAELSFFRTVTSIVLGFANNCTPKVAIEQARRGVATELRPNMVELQRLFTEVDSGLPQAAA